MRISMRAVAFAAALNFLAPVSAQPSYDDLKRRSENIIALIDAEGRKPTLCAGFEGKPVKLTPFAYFEEGLKGLAPKGEFETTAAYIARVGAARNAVAGTYVLSLPVDRDYIRYDADHKLLSVQAGAFGGNTSYDPSVTVVIWGTVPLEIWKQGTNLPYSQSERTVRKYHATNLMGVGTMVSDVARTTRSIFSSIKLFPWLADYRSTVFFAEASPAAAPSKKAALGLALVVEVVAPYMLSTTSDGQDATVTSPTKYTERVSILFVKPRCAVLMDQGGIALDTIVTGPAE